MNVLLTCVGRRNYLVAYFREALAGSGKILAADARREAPALVEADQSFILPKIDHPEYISELVRICRTHAVGLIIPLNDLELPVLARNRKLLLEQGSIPVVSSADVVETCFDKARSHRFLADRDLPVLTTCESLEDVWPQLEAGRFTFPLVVKPRWGTASIGIIRADDEEELRLAHALALRLVSRSIIGRVSARGPASSVLVQQWLNGQEYGLDVVNDLTGAYVTTFAKRKIEMRSGETSSAVTVRNPQLTKLGELLGRHLGHIGNLDVDVILHEGIPYVLEMNPRFGGGYPFSHVAGADLPAALLAWAQQREPSPGTLEVLSGVVATKCDRLVITQRTDAEEK